MGNEAGQTLVMFPWLAMIFFLLVVLISMASYFMIFSWRMQIAADAAALGGAREIMLTYLDYPFQERSDLGDEIERRATAVAQYLADANAPSQTVFAVRFVHANEVEVTLSRAATMPYAGTIVRKSTARVAVDIP